MKVDTTRPSIGRMYDYVLGGHHNLEVDRQAADKVLKLLPLYKKGAQLNRWFLSMVASRWAEQGITHVLDCASGLPTQGHFNEQLPEATILFSDRDQLSVAYAQEILAGQQHQKYIEADLCQPQAFLAQAAQFFGDHRRLAVGIIGISYFLSDQALQELFHGLHALCAPGSVLACTFLSLPADGTKAGSTLEALDLYNRLANAQLVLRPPEEFTPLIKPWHLTELRNVEEWLEMQGYFTSEEKSVGDIIVHGFFASHS